VDTFGVQRISSRKALLLALCLGALLAGVAWGAGEQSGSAAGPRLVLSVPDEVLVGDPIEVQLTIEDANGIAGFEVTVGFDTEAASLQRFQPGENDLAAMGLDVQGLGPVEVPGGIAIGAYACPYSDCADPATAARNEQNGTGAYRLATMTLVGWQAGPLTIDLSSARFADLSGRPVEVDLSAAVVTVEVMPNGEVE
jgi:hypothetical protein